MYRFSRWLMHAIRGTIRELRPLRIWLHRCWGCGRCGRLVLDRAWPVRDGRALQLICDCGTRNFMWEPR